MMDCSGFTNPFRYTPHPLVKEAASRLISRIDSTPELAEAFSEGKMLGVLICSPGPVTLYAFSGNAGGKSHIEGFVPPIFDLLAPDGNYRKKEAEISEINRKITELETFSEYTEIQNETACSVRDMEEAVALMREEMSIRKMRRREIRNRTSDPDILAALIRESQHDKAELRRLKHDWETRIAQNKEKMSALQDEISSLKKLRAEKSDALQRWIFGQYIVTNALGERKSIWEIFSDKGLVSPGGTGECAAPKLLEHAYRNGLKPLSMGEFWYGKSPDTAVRTHGHFYPSCTSKCGPLLTYMLSGLELRNEMVGGTGRNKTDMIFEDRELIAVNKPSGIPSVPGLDGRESFQEALEKELGIRLYAVHRLDMDTSGIIIYAKTRESETNLKKQFEDHTVRKTYMARLCPPDHSQFTAEIHDLKTGDTGRIELPLSADYDERPRQKVDMIHGKTAVTGYEVSAVNEDGTTDILFHPVTGRTHQLRVHSAHMLGLGRPILGDTLYGGTYNGCIRLHLHALSISFTHPATGEFITFRTEDNPIR